MTTTNGHVTTSAFFARQIAVARHRPIPVPSGEKGATIPEWQKLRISPEEVDEYFPNGHNVGLLTGVTGLLCVDKDCAEAVAVADHLLPPTLESGRDNSPRSKAFYKVRGGSVPPTKRYKIPKKVEADGKKATVVELLSTGSQAVVTGVHPSGDRYRWESGRFDAEKIAEVGDKELSEMVLDVAVAAVVLRYYPGEGDRHDYVLKLSGYLLRHLPEERVKRIVEAAAQEAHDDEVSSRLRDVASTRKNLKAGRKVTGGPTLHKEYPELFAILGQDSWLGEFGAEPDAPPPTQSVVLLELASGCELYHDEKMTGYATFSTGGHHETHKLRSKGFKQHLSRRFFEKMGKPPSSQALQDAVEMLDGRAAFEGEERTVAVRLATHDDAAVYLDLCNDAWEVVEITAEGWRIIGHADAPIHFRRAQGMRPLPIPSRGGSLEGLKRLLNIPDEEEAGWTLIKAWLVAALRGRGPYPLLVLQGEQGTAKSTAEKILRMLIDPSTTPLRTTPRDERDLMIAANNSLVIAYDNISHLPDWLSDSLCRLATGGGLSTRALFTDDEEILFDAIRPCLLNGIANVANRPDLVDRSLIIELPVIEEEDRRLESELRAAFEAEHPSILGALLDAVSAALRNLPTTRLSGFPRMADFAHWATAAETALGLEEGGFMDAYTGNRSDAVLQSLASDPVAGAVWRFMRDRDEWTGTAEPLLRHLSSEVDEEVKKSNAWPKAPHVLAGRLKRLAPALRSAFRIGYEETKHPTTRAKQKRLYRLPGPNASERSPNASERSPNASEGGQKVHNRAESNAPNPPNACLPTQSNDPPNATHASGVNRQAQTEKKRGGHEGALDARADQKDGVRKEAFGAFGAFAELEAGEQGYVYEIKVRQALRNAYAAPFEWIVNATDLSPELVRKALDAFSKEGSVVEEGGLYSLKTRNED